MWYSDFADRLESWAGLRTAANSVPLEQALELIDGWWQRTPWQPYYLHWDDEPTWPDPWQLLSDNVFCELARGLGILYTVSMLDHPDLASARLVLTEEGCNLVEVNNFKYILNYSSLQPVNTPLGIKVKRSLAAEQIKQRYK
jgi:hypothetical protein